MLFKGFIEIGIRISMAQKILLTPYCHCITMLLFISFTVVISDKVLLKATIDENLNNLIEYTGAIGMTNAESLTICMMDCARDNRCVAYFYTEDSLQCILHSKHFYPSFDPPSGTESGWKYFKMNDVSVGCPATASYYRPLDFCYMISEITPIDFATIKTSCSKQNGRVASVRTPEMQAYFTHMLAGRPHSRICIAGEEQPDGTWKLDDGTKLTFFQWYPGQPESINQPCLVIKKTNLMGDAWFDSSCSFSQSCTYVCEINM